MIKNIEDAFSEMYAAYEYYEENGEKYKRLMKEWADSIIDLCAESFECEMEDDIEIEENDKSDSNNNFYSSKHPVLILATVLEVKNKIK